MGGQKSLGETSLSTLVTTFKISSPPPESISPSSRASGAQEASTVESAAIADVPFVSGGTSATASSPEVMGRAVLLV